MFTSFNFGRFPQWIAHANRSLFVICRHFAITALLAITCCQANAFQPPEPSDTDPPKVTLRWKFMPNQSYLGKLHSGIRTIDENRKDTSYTFEYRWDVQSVDENGDATIKVIVNHERIRHRGTKSTVDLDSDTFSAFSPSETELSEIGTILAHFREIPNREFIFRFSSIGQTEQLTKYEWTPGQVVLWPILPEQPVGVGDTWTDEISDGGPKVYELVQLEDVDGELIALIESKADTMRYRFLVDRGKFLDGCGWDILGSAQEDESEFYQSFSSRVRLELASEDPTPRNLRMLQPNQPRRSIDMVYQSAKQTDSIKEYLLGEKSALNSLQDKIFVEISNDIIIPEERENLSPYEWLLYARYIQRRGELDKYKQFLRDGAEATKRDSNTPIFYRNIFLLQFAELLAESGEFDAARNACAAISDEGRAAFALTLKGAITTPSSSMRSYAMLLVIRKMAQAGLVTESISASQILPNRSEKSAAHWIIALESAQRGDIKNAFEQCAVGESLYSPGMIVIEFDRVGPQEIPLDQYRTLALGKLAICQVKQHDENGMRKTLELIETSKEKSAVIVDMIVALEDEGLNELAEKISATTSQATQSLAAQMRVRRRIELHKLSGIDRLIDSLSDPGLNAASRMELCKAIQFDKNQAAELKKQLDLSQAAIGRIANPKTQSVMRVKYASMMSNVRSPEETLAYLDETLEMVRGLKADASLRTELLLEIADILPRVSNAMDFENRIESVQGILRGDGALKESSVRFAIMNSYAHKDMMEAAEKLAKGFRNESDRCKAYCAIGRRYSQTLEMERSREWFSKAFEVAIKVADLSGLDTVDSKGGAIRYVGQQQGECDLEGLVIFLEKSTDPNILAYGWLGGAESLEPKAASLAADTARIPLGMLKDICDSNLACKLLQERPRP